MSIEHLELERHNELSAFLRSRRARILPEHVGLPRGTRRRTPGLRRGEVALLAGVSPEWYTWLEQGRDIHVSVQVLERLASVLQLDTDERAHLFLLALRQPPPVETFSPPTVSPTLQRFLDHLETSPASVLDARLNGIAQNKAHCAVFGDHTNRPERERNLIWTLFSQASRRKNEEWQHLARVYLAHFRAGYGRYINDPWWAEQIEELSKISAEFRELWPRHDVFNVSEGRKTMNHPRAGTLTFDFLWLQTVDAGDVRILIHTPSADTDTAAKIAWLMDCDADTENK